MKNYQRLSEKAIGDSINGATSERVALAQIDAVDKQNERKAKYEEHKMYAVSVLIAITFFVGVATVYWNNSVHPSFFNITCALVGYFVGKNVDI